MRKIHLTKLEGNKNRYGTKYSGLFLPEDVEIISNLERAESERDLLPQEFVFTYADVANDFPDFLAQWIRYASDFEDALSRYYTTLYHSQTVEEQHLSLTRSLDAYYGIKYNQIASNDFPRKIRELATRQHPHVAKWEPKIDVFVEKVKATRHFHTHYNPAWKTKEMCSPELA